MHISRISGDDRDPRRDRSQLTTGGHRTSNGIRIANARGMLGSLGRIPNPVRLVRLLTARGLSTRDKESSRPDFRGAERNLGGAATLWGQTENSLLRTRRAQVLARLAIKTKTPRG